MRGENARLGVETTTRSDHIARSATKPRSSSSTDQRHSARPDRSWLEKAQHSGPRIGSSSLILKWRETGGPIVGAPPRPGFGTNLIRDLIPHELSGTVDLVFRPDGVCCSIEVSL